MSTGYRLGLASYLSLCHCSHGRIEAWTAGLKPQKWLGVGGTLQWSIFSKGTVSVLRIIFRLECWYLQGHWIEDCLNWSYQTAVSKVSLLYVDDGAIGKDGKNGEIRPRLHSETLSSKLIC